MTGPAPGSLADEARRLAEALTTWSRTHGGPLAETARAYAGPLAEAARAYAGPPADGSPGNFSDWAPHAGGSGQPPAACRYCPLCRLIAVLRGDRPEAAARLVATGSAFAEALWAVLAPPGGPAEEPAPTVQHVHVD